MTYCVTDDYSLFCRFPPGVGAIGTAALLNVPKSLEQILTTLKESGYDVGGLPSPVDGEAIVTYLKEISKENILSRGADYIKKEYSSKTSEIGATPQGQNISAKQLRSYLTFDESWGPNEWGPMPFLPSPDILVRKMQKAWGDLGQYRAGLSTAVNGDSVVTGLQFGNVFIGVQPLLGVEGDPMRLLFERDLTPHPQYAAFYKWLEVRRRYCLVLKSFCQILIMN